MIDQFGSITLPPMNKPPTQTFATIETAKLAAPRMTYNGETQVVCEIEGGYQLFTIIVSFGNVSQLNNLRVVSQRSFCGTCYATGQQGQWVDTE